MNPRILDCTLRDGGYYNAWCFSKALARDYLRAVDRAGVDFVEIGFRNFTGPGFVGPYAYSTDAFLETLPIPESCELGVMVDAKTILSSPYEPEDAVGRLFAERGQSRVGLVRVAAHFEEVPHCGETVETLKRLGYRVGLNIMQMAGRPLDRVSELASMVESWGSVDVLYFADSLGSMDVEDVDGAVDALREGWSGDLGIHTHNNKGQAIQNSLHAVGIGVQYVDATILGMGRGAGNAQLGILLGELTHRGIRAFELADVYSVGERHFRPLQEEYRWGSNFFYHYSALNDIHPMFAQTLLADRRYSEEEKFSALVSLAGMESRSFSRTDMDRLLHPVRPSDAASDAIAPADLSGFNGASVLIVGAGGSAREYAEDVELFIEQHRPHVLTLNHQTALPLERVDGIICVDQHRLLYEAEFLASCDRPVYTASRLLNPSVRKILETADLRQYDCLVQDGTFAAHDDGCVIPEPLAIAYALALCVSGKVARVFLVGFDGFAADDSRQHQMLNVLHLAEPRFESIPMIALTPTNYPIAQGSIYADYR